MKNLSTMLKGKKTYLIALAVAAVVFLQLVGIVSDEMAKTLYGFLGAGGLATLRAGLSKS